MVAELTTVKPVTEVMVAPANSDPIVLEKDGEDTRGRFRRITALIPRGKTVVLTMSVDGVEVESRSWVAEAENGCNPIAQGRLMVSHKCRLDTLEPVKAVDNGG